MQPDDMASDTARQIADLEKRLGDLRRDRAAADAAASAERAERARARLAGEKAKRGESGREKDLGEIEEAIALGAVQLERLRGIAREEAAAAAEQTRREELRALADALPEVAKLLDGVIGVIERHDPLRQRREGVFAAVGRAFRDAVVCSNAGRPAAVASALAEMAADYRRQAEPAVPIVLRPRPPMVADSAILVSRDFRWRDAGNPGVAEWRYAAGAVVLVPAEVARAAVARSLAKVLIEAQPHGRRRVRFTESYPRGDGAVYPRDGIFLLDQDVAEQAIRSGMAVSHATPSERELETARKGYAADTTPTSLPIIDLGTFNEAVADDARALDELAGDAPQAAPIEPARRRRGGEQLVEAFQ